MQKTTITTYTIDQPNGATVTLNLDGDYLVIRNIYPNGDIETEVNIHATVGTMSDLHTVIDEIESVVIGE
jgi:hypothetical protein